MAGGGAEWCTEEVVVKQLANEFEIGENKLMSAMEFAEAFAPPWIQEPISKQRWNRHSEFFPSLLREGEVILCDRAGAGERSSLYQCAFFRCSEFRERSLSFQSRRGFFDVLSPRSRSRGRCQMGGVGKLVFCIATVLFFSVYER